MNTLNRHLQHGPGLSAAGVGVLLDRGQQHPHQVDGVVEQRNAWRTFPVCARAASDNQEPAGVSGTPKARDSVYRVSPLTG